MDFVPELCHVGLESQQDQEGWVHTICVAQHSEIENYEMWRASKNIAYGQSCGFECRVKMDDASERLLLTTLYGPFEQPHHRRASSSYSLGFYAVVDRCMLKQTRSCGLATRSLSINPVTSGSSSRTVMASRNTLCESFAWIFCSMIIPITAPDPDVMAGCMPFL